MYLTRFRSSVRQNGWTRETVRPGSTVHPCPQPRSDHENASEFFNCDRCDENECFEICPLQGICEETEGKNEEVGNANTLKMEHAGPGQAKRKLLREA